MSELDTIRSLILKNLPFIPNREQIVLVEALSLFLDQRGPNDVLILNGYAGTGKTSIIGAFVKTLKLLRKKSIVLAPTGRAAKVAAKLAEGKASTIHKKLFRGDSSNPVTTKFFLSKNTDTDTFFIVDEASLITDGSSSVSSLLCQLVNYVYSGSGCSMILLGDNAQLPPIGQKVSPALLPDRLRQLGLNPYLITLKEPARHEAESGILFNATNIRKLLFNNSSLENFSIIKKNFDDIRLVDPVEMIDELSSSWARVGKDETIVITRSNYRANIINKTIRHYLLDAEEPLVKGERLVISKNDYFWGNQNKTCDLIANGEIAEVNKVGRKFKKYGRWFAETELSLGSLVESVNVLIMLRSLATEGPQIPKEEMERFFNRILNSEEGEASIRIKATLSDPCYNALQVKYGYCVTCHKAQGGQWKHVYIDLGGLASDLSETDFFRWLYTAVTRATERVYFINSPFPVS